MAKKKTKRSDRIFDIKKVLKNADFVFVATNHAYYKKLNLQEIKKLVSKNCVICDVWNVFKTNKIIFTVGSVKDLKAKKLLEKKPEFKSTGGILEGPLTA